MIDPPVAADATHRWLRHPGSLKSFVASRLDAVNLPILGVVAFADIVNGMASPAADPGVTADPIRTDVAHALNVRAGRFNARLWPLVDNAAIART